MTYQVSEKMMKRVFFDLDGVVFDFVGGFEALMGFPIPDGSKDLVENFNLIDRDFFVNLPVYDDAISMMYSLRDAGFEIAVLSSAGDYRHSECVAQKLVALDRAGLGWIEDVRFVEHSYEKAMFASEGILIDDREKSLVPFWKAGGVAFFYENGMGAEVVDGIMASVGM